MSVARSERPVTIGEKLAMIACGCLAIAIVALTYFALTSGDGTDHGISPQVRTHLRQGYGLSSTKRPGWVPVHYNDRLWYVSPQDLVP